MFDCMKAALLLLFAVAQTEDVLSTAAALGLPGIYEGNPAMAWCIAELGALWWLPKAALVLFAVLVARRIRPTWPLAAVSALTFLAVLNNVARL